MPAHRSPEDPAATAGTRAIRVGVLVVAVVVALQTTIHLVNYSTVWHPLWDVNFEFTVFSVLQAGTLLLAAGACLAAARARVVPRRPAGVLAGILVLFAVDDLFSLHEKGTDRFLSFFDVSRSWDSVVWPLLYLPVTGVAFLILVFFARRAPRAVRRPLTWALLLLVAAVAAEILSAPFSTDETWLGVVHAWEGAFEEGCELGAWGLVAVSMFGWARARTVAGGGAPGHVRPDVRRPLGAAGASSPSSGSRTAPRAPARRPRPAAG